MATLKQASEDYVAPQTLNIADLELVPLDCEISEKTFKEGTDEEFTINVATINGEAYRVPNSVLDSIKTLIAEMPNIKYVKVLKEGSGLNTRYKTVPKEAPAGPTEVSSQQM